MERGIKARARTSDPFVFIRPSDSSPYLFASQSMTKKTANSAQKFERHAAPTCWHVGPDVPRGQVAAPEWTRGQSGPCGAYYATTAHTGQPAPAPSEQRSGAHTQAEAGTQHAALVWFD